VFQFLGNAVQGFIFAYLGLTFFAYSDFQWSSSLFSYMLGIVIIGRFVGTLGLVKFLDTFCNYQSGVSTKDVSFVAFCGVIRGAIAFGLVLRLDPSLPNRSLIVTTALSIVLFTTIFFGSIVGMVSKCIVEDSPKKVENLLNDDEFETRPSAFFGHGKNYNEPEEDDKFKDADRLGDASGINNEFDLSQHNEFLHPNQQELDEQAVLQLEKGSRVHMPANASGFTKYFTIFD
jgi:hypothetical protein